MLQFLYIACQDTVAVLRKGCYIHRVKLRY